MPSDPKVLAKRFAISFQEAVLEAQGEKGAEKVREQMEGLLELNRGEVGTFFVNPVFGVEEKITVLHQFLKKNVVEGSLQRFVELLISLRYIQLLPDILQKYDEAELERRNEAKAVVRTAFPLSEKDKKQIADALSKATHKKVMLDVQMDKDLIGGVVAEVGSMVFDASIQGYINRLQQEL